ncbi:SGNH/GDSL hydrolase family protein [Paenibacillus sp. FSL E2-0201]|uniref:SGNH/GDSL hydrolase family protein n=1 Tax=Paenibacillus sp. FSL E2-0201 TaxID=2954726 RepID=UPI0030D9F649
MSISLKQNALVLFQGDSLTDAGRSREELSDLGRGYALMTSAALLAKYPERQFTFLNRGKSGDRARNLRERWQEDCIELQPNLVSVLIGVNDTWRRYTENDPTSAGEFHALYHSLLTEVKAMGAEIVLIEPFLFPNHPEYKLWREDLDPKIGIVRELSREFKTAFVPMDGLFAQACVRAEAAYWSHDGVHATPAGHALITKAWLDAVNIR